MGGHRRGRRRNTVLFWYCYCATAQPRSPAVASWPPRSWTARSILEGMEAGLEGTKRVISPIPSSANIPIVSQCDPYQYPPDTAFPISILYVLSLTLPLPQPRNSTSSTVCHHPLPSTNRPASASLPPLHQQATLPTHTPHPETIQTAPPQIPLLPRSRYSPTLAQMYLHPHSQRYHAKAPPRTQASSPLQGCERVCLMHWRSSGARQCIRGVNSYCTVLRG